MKTTGNLGLKKPEGTDLVDIADLNGNMDILDNAVNGKVDKVSGKQLSTNDYTTPEKTKLAGIATGANNYTHPNHTGDVTSNGDGVTAIAAGVIVDADVNANAGIKFSKINAAGSIKDSDINDEAYIDMLKIGTGRINNALLDYLFGVTGPIQGQLNSKLPFTGGLLTGDLTFAPAASTTSSWSKLARFQYNKTGTGTVERTLGVNTAGNLIFSEPGVIDSMVALSTNGDLTYYVRTDGNDNNNGLANTPAGAFKTWQKALDSLPKVINHSVNIYIADGTYNENVSIKGFSGGGTLTLTGNTSNAALVMVSSVDQYENFIAVTLSFFMATTTTRDSFTVNRCVGFRINDCRSIGVAPTGNGIITYFSIGIISNGVYSNKGSGINANASSQIDVIGTAGTGNTIGLAAGDGAILTKFGITITGTQNESCAGATITGGVLNPWGDNTTATRSNFKAWHTIAQTITSNTMVKLVYSTKVFDPLSEYNASISRFTASQDGVYLVSAATSITGAPAGTVLVLTAWVNGARNTDIGSSPVGSNTLYAQGSTPIKLTAGMYVEIYTFLNTSAGSLNTLGSNGELNHFAVTRIA